MLKLVQSRVGNSGTCFRTCIASLLNLVEDQVPDFPNANLDLGVDSFLAPYGLEYRERPIDRDRPPKSYHVILGVSPRGGEHAVVGYKGNFVHDPHPVSDDPRRGLAKERTWGELLPFESGTRATDSKAAEVLRTRHDEIVSNHLRSTGSSAETAYNALYRPTVSLVHDAEVLLTKTRLDDDPAYWHRKLESAQDHLDEAVRLAKSGKYGQATSYLDAALTMAHMVIDKMRNSGRTRGRDTVENFCECESESHGHKAAGCKSNKGLRQYDVGGYKQTLCPNCSLQAAKYGREAKVPVMFAKDYSPTARRVRLHRALDRVLDSVSAKEGGIR